MTHLICDSTLFLNFVHIYKRGFSITSNAIGLYPKEIDLPVLPASIVSKTTARGIVPGDMVSSRCSLLAWCSRSHCYGCMTVPPWTGPSVVQGVAVAFWEGVFVSVEFSPGGLNKDTQIPQGRDCQKGSVAGPVSWGGWFTWESSFNRLSLTKKTIGPIVFFIG